MSDTIKPVAWLCPVDDGDGPDISCNWEYASLFKGKADPLYTADALRQARDDALEEAKQLVLQLDRYGFADVDGCAHAIEALKEKRDE